MATKTQRHFGVRGKKLSASSYFETLRTISSDKQVLEAAKQAEAQISAKTKAKEHSGG